ncbi:carboxymuconolactone decarboxylase family protein [Fictibacillus nanhaiensis]|uniref:carboxymuconolactone decarboxylase family protein n=1 Tax=Fictibacillus nanhaiensis TaxID=742169 RepID=UPI003C2AAB61
MDYGTLDESSRKTAMKQGNAELSEREKLALELADHIMAYHGQLPDDLYNRLQQYFSKEEIIALFFQIGSKNGANWFIIAMGILNE